MTRSIPALLRLLGASGLGVPLLALGLPTLAACGADDGATATGTPGSGSTTPAGSGGASGEGGSASGGGSGSGGASGDDVLEGPCPLGSSRECKVQNESGCLTGRQYCVDGLWSDCERHVGRSMKNRALTDGSEACGATDDTTENTCDAGCQAIAPTEIPDFGEGSTSIVDWVVGSLGDVPPDALQEALIEPCNDDRDCELDHYCGGSGACIPFAPGQTNPLCADTWDVSVPVPCGGNVIICNRGGQPIPEATIEAEFEIKYRAPGNPIANNTYWMDGCSLGGVDGTCPVDIDGDVPPGECVPIPCDVPVGYTVFLDGGPGNSEECECGNNWSMNPGGECGEPLCGGSIATAEEVPLTIFLLVDISLSIEPHWDTISDGVNAFLQDPANAGIGVVLKFWPTGRCSTSSCDADGPYNTGGTCAFHPCSIRTGTGASHTLGATCDPTVQDMCDESSWRRCCGLGTSGTKSWNAACQVEYDRRTGGACSACDHGSIANTSHTLDGYRFTLPAPPLVTAMNAVSSFPANTPVAEAFTGAVSYARDYMAAHPGERAVVVAPTDANYSSGVSCTPAGAQTETATRNAVGAGFDDGVYTYIIGTSGLSSSARTDLSELAAEGGTGAATFLTAGGGASELTERLQEIANSFACQYAVPDDTDPALVTVEWNHGDGTETALVEVDDVTDCGAGVPAYYYSSLTALTLCPGTCSDVRDDSDSTVELAIACDVSAVPVTYTAEFTAQGECTDIGTFPKWTLLLYNAEVPPGSSIEVRAATKLYADDADYRTEVDVVSITDANESSDMSAPTRLDTPLGSEAFGEILRLQFESTVAGGAPDMLDYEVQFTCAPTE